MYYGIAYWTTFRPVALFPNICSLRKQCLTISIYWLSLTYIYICQRTRPSLVEEMGCHLYCDNPLPEAVLCWLDSNLFRDQWVNNYSGCLSVIICVSNPGSFPFYSIWLTITAIPPGSITPCIITALLRINSLSGCTFRVVGNHRHLASSFLCVASDKLHRLYYVDNDIW